MIIEDNSNKSIYQNCNDCDVYSVDICGGEGPDRHYEAEFVKANNSSKPPIFFKYKNKRRVKSNVNENKVSTAELQNGNGNGQDFKEVCR